MRKRADGAGSSPAAAPNFIFPAPAAGGGSRHIGRAPGPHIPSVCKDAGRTAYGTAVRPPQGRGRIGDFESPLYTKDAAQGG